jgi:hypothetical protein
MGTRQLRILPYTGKRGLPVLYRWAESQREEATAIFQGGEVRKDEA